MSITGNQHGGSRAGGTWWALQVTNTVDLGPEGPDEWALQVTNTVDPGTNGLDDDYWVGEVDLWIFWIFNFLQLAIDRKNNSKTKVAKVFFFMSSYAEMSFLKEKNH
jgi:hypothetical protein